MSLGELICGSKYLVVKLVVSFRWFVVMWEVRGFFYICFFCSIVSFYFDFGFLWRAGSISLSSKRFIGFWF